MSQTRTSVDLSDPRWFPFDLNLDAGLVRFLRVEPQVLADSVFLDHRIALQSRVPVEVPLAEVARAPSHGDGAPAYLFHTSFCCSTLLARALHVAPQLQVLKEPFALRRLSDAAHARRTIDAWVPVVARLLARPWDAGAQVLVKPTHVALNLAAQLLDVVPGTRAIVLHSSLEDFIVSNHKKPPETQQKVAVLAARLVADAGLDPGLAERAHAAAGWPGLVAVQWTAGIKLAQQLLRHAPDRVRALSDRELLDDFARVVADVVAWLQLRIEPAALAAHLPTIGRQHAKVTTLAYDAAARGSEADLVRRMFGAQIARALAWAGEHCLPLLDSPLLAPRLRG